MIHYRNAASDEAKAIARMHARSWQLHYRGMMRDHYLDHEVEADRLQVWEERFQAPNPRQHILCAEDGETLCGFACTFAYHDPVWGHYLDNLHVLPAYQGQKIGQELMRRSVIWALEQDAALNFYLWVFEKNTQALGFYEALGARVAERTTVDNPGGGKRLGAPLCVGYTVQTRFEPLSLTADPFVYSFL